MTRSKSTTAVLAAAVIGLALALIPSSAYAITPTQIRFLDPAPLTLDFGSTWVIPLTVESTYTDRPAERLNSSDGTVDVYVSGIPGAYASGLPIQADGTVYFAQPSTKVPLAAGEYDVTAIYTPPQGSSFESTQTSAPLALTVSGFTLEPAAVIKDEPSAAALPLITASLAGSYVDATGGSPAGVWTFVLSNSKGATSFETEFSVAEGSEPTITVEVTTELARGATYTLVSSFLPVEDLRGGITVAETAPSTLQTRENTVGEAIQTPVRLPYWLVGLMALILIGATTLAVAFGIRSRRLAPKTATTEPHGDPELVDDLSWEEAGIVELAPHDDGQSGWSLSDSAGSEISDIETATVTPRDDNGDKASEAANSEVSVPTSRVKKNKK